MTIEHFSNEMAVGRFYRNGGRNLFAILKLDENTVVYEEYNSHGPIGRELRMGRKVFAALVKNYHLTPAVYLFNEETGRWREPIDLDAERQFEFNRNMKR